MYSKFDTEILRFKIRDVSWRVFMGDFQYRRGCSILMCSTYIKKGIHLKASRIDPRVSLSYVEGAE